MTGDRSARPPGLSDGPPPPDGPADPWRLIEDGRLLDVLWNATQQPGSDPRSECLAAAVAAQHVGLWHEARALARVWSRGNPHVETGPRVSIIVPTYDRRDLLRRALASLAAQLYRPLEVVVVNDAGPPVGDVVDAFRNRLDIVEVVHSENLHLAGARNSGLARASGDYVGYLDDDDQLYPHHVGHLVALLREGSARAAWAAPHMARNDDAGRTRLERYERRPFELDELLLENVTPVQAVLHEAALIDEIGRFDGALEVNEDWEFWIRLRQRTAVLQSDVITSWVDARDGEARMTGRGLAPFLFAHETIYRRYARETLRAGGRSLCDEQQRYLERIAADAARRLFDEQRPALVIVDDPDIELSNDDRMQQDTVARALGGQLAGEYADAIELYRLDGRDPRAMRDALPGLAADTEAGLIALVPARALAMAADGWLLRPLLRLDADPATVAVRADGGALVARRHGLESAAPVGEPATADELLRRLARAWGVGEPVGPLPHDRAPAAVTASIRVVAEPRPRRLAVVPSDPLEAYVAKGRGALLAGYYNPGRCFDEVYCLSPLESRVENAFGMRVIPTDEAGFAARLRELQIDVVRAYGGYWPCDLACAGRLDGVPVVVSVHDTNPDLLHDSVRRADHVLAVSPAVERLLRERGVDPARIRLLPNRVDLSVFSRRTDAPESLEFARRFPGRYRVLHVGRRSEQKNLDTLIRALGLLGDRYAGIFVGRGDDAPYRRLAAECDAAERCHFIDSVPNDELPGYYSYADAVCIPSRWEGFGIVFAEALACGAVVVSSDLPPMNEMMEHGTNALLVGRHEDPAALAEAIAAACTDSLLRVRLRSRARAAAEPFDRDTIDAREAACYGEILATAGRTGDGHVAVNGADAAMEPWRIR